MVKLIHRSAVYTSVLSVTAFTSHTMSESAEALAAAVESRRNVTIEITNLTNNYCLIDPKYVQNKYTFAHFVCTD